LKGYVLHAVVRYTKSKMSHYIRNM